MEPIYRIRIRDLTAELKRKDPTRVLLYNKNIFPETYDAVNNYIEQRTVMEAIKNVMKKRGMIVDIMSEEVEIDTKMSPIGHTGLVPPFSLFDISHYLSIKKPVLNLLFDNDIFDHPHDVEAEDSRYFDTRLNKSKITNYKNNKDSPITLFVRVIVPEDEEPEPK